MMMNGGWGGFGGVVPRVGTWIEIFFMPKFRHKEDVVPRVGTWIEIALSAVTPAARTCRPPRGDVD